MKKRIKLNNARPQAWLGTAIATAASLAGNIISSNERKKEIERNAAKQAALNQYNKALAEATSLSNSLTQARDRQEEYNDDFHVDYACGGKVRKKASLGTILPFLGVAGLGLSLLDKNIVNGDVANSPEYQEKLKYDDIYQFKCGGKRKLKNGGVITDGGVAIPIGNSTYLLQGSSHNQINESGNTGIGIKVGNREIEAEGGEVVSNDGNYMKIYSDTLKLPRRRYLRNGGKGKITPAEAVIEGYDKDKVFAAQEKYKKEKGLESENNKADLGAIFNTTDYIGLGTNVLGSILSNSILRNSYNKAKAYAPEQPIRYAAGKLKTYYNIHPQLANLERNRLRTNKAIYDNTWSSVAALNRMNTVNTDAIISQNQLWGDKVNKETDLINRDILNRQEVYNKNVDALNAYRNQLNDYNRGLELAKAESNASMIQGIGSSIGNFLQSGIDNYQNSQARLALLAGSEKGTLERLANFGYKIDDNTAKAAYRMALADVNTNVNDIGARQRADFWRNYFGVRPQYKNKFLSLAKVGGVKVPVPTTTYSPTINI